MTDLLNDIALGIGWGVFILAGAWLLWFSLTWRRRPARTTVADSDAVFEQMAAMRRAQQQYHAHMQSMVYSIGPLPDGQDDLPTMTMEEGHVDLLQRARQSSKVFDILMVMAVDVEDYELAAKLRDQGRPS